MSKEMESFMRDLLALMDKHNGDIAYDHKADQMCLEIGDETMNIPREDQI